jgi:hypothetical protein
MERVCFLTVENTKDLIVSFAIEADEPGEVKSLTLIRTPIYERVLPDDERGVSVSHEAFPEHRNDLLCRISISSETARIETRNHKYDLDISHVEPSELQEASEVLRLMNFDQSFALHIA